LAGGALKGWHSVLKRLIEKYQSLEQASYTGDAYSHPVRCDRSLKDFRTKEVVGSGGVKTMGIVKFELLVVRGRAASIVSIAGYVCENFRTNASTNNKLVEIDGSREHVRSARMCSSMHQ